ncbi:MFS transporter [Streptococcus anginosus]|uniref:MFS transporter n=1 Tax=Streptococcus anginosus TaxID=1328 RepID=UPI0034A4A1AA
MKKLWDNFFISASIVDFINVTFRMLLIFYFSNQFHSTTQIAYIMLADSLPFLLLGPFIANLVNRYNRKVLMSLSLGFDSLITLIILLVIYSNYNNFLFILILLSVNNITTSLFQISETSYFPLLVDNKELAKYNSALFFMSSLSLIISPNISLVLSNQLIITLIICFIWLFQIVALVNSLLLKNISITKKEENKYQKISLVSSFLYTFKSKTLFVALIVLIIGNFFDAPLETVILSKYTAINKVSQVGLLFSMSGLGSLLGSSIVNLVSKDIKKFELIMKLSSILITFSGIALFLLDNYIIYLILFACLYFSMSVRTIYIITFRQIKSPSEILGSINTLFKYIAFGISPISIWIFSQLGKFMTDSILLKLIGLGFIITGLISFLSLKEDGKLLLEE